jgi:hypothetical protein
MIATVVYTAFHITVNTAVYIAAGVITGHIAGWKFKISISIRISFIKHNGTIPYLYFDYKLFL